MAIGEYGGTPNLLSAKTTTGAGSALTVSRNTREGFVSVHFFGTFDGTTSVKLQSSLDNVTWVDIPNAVATAATVINVSINTYYIRANVTAGGTYSVNAHLI